MLRRALLLLAFTAVVSPLHARAQDREWEEDYGDRGTDEQAPSDDYRVSVDMDTGNDAGVSLDTFQGALSPYGDWMVVGGLGRVWRPHVAAGWRPYYYGRWEWTNEGWLWVSEEPFGWAAYHYGRWTYDGGYGWVWSPGYQWGPAWVSWRYSGDVVGWAPLGPGVSVYVETYPFVSTWWTFVPCHAFVGGPVYRAAFAPGYTRRYFDQTTAAPPRSFPGRRMDGGRERPASGPAWGGPPPRVIETRIGRPLQPVRVVTAPAPGPSRMGNGEVSIFRPGSRGGRAVPVQAPRPERPGFSGDPARPVPGREPREGGSVPGGSRPGPSAQLPHGQTATPTPVLPHAERPQRREVPVPRAGAGSPSGTGFGGGRAQPAPGVQRAAPSTPSPAPAPRVAPQRSNGGGGARAVPVPREHQRR